MNASNPNGLKGSIKGDAERRERLASELRANLKKRKAQARLRAAGDGVRLSVEPTQNDDTTAPTDC